MTAPVQRLVEAPVGLPRLLAGPDGTETLRAHVQRLGPVPVGGRGRRDDGALVDDVERSGLRGRGGSAFPTATKMHAVRAGRGPRFVVANGSEGEPASAKDVLLLERRPHLVLDGAVVAARAVRAAQVFVAVDRAAIDARRSLARALDERRAMRVDDVSVQVVEVPGRYVAGEEKALVHLINGGEAKPTFDTRPYERGVRGRATLVQNVETLAHIALLARFGPEWFRSAGSDESPGTALVTLGGAVQRPGVYEIELGTSIGEVVGAAGGPTEDIAAFLTGGYYGTWLATPGAWQLRLGPGELAQVGAAFGCGVVHALAATACGLAETARVARYLAGESAGQCGPCVHGLTAIAGALDEIATGHDVEHHAALVRRWSGQVSGRGACRLPDGAVRFVATAFDVFAPEIARHTAHGACAESRRPASLPVPSPAQRKQGWR
jgi:NADH:ubiquinone oxidoreductase subunit F (NADH-binding)